MFARWIAKIAVVFAEEYDREKTSRRIRGEGYLQAAYDQRVWGSQAHCALQARGVPRGRDDFGEEALAVGKDQPTHLVPPSEREAGDV